MAKQTNTLHICMQLSREVCILPSSQHVKGFSKGQIAHDIEAVVIEPLRHIHRFANILADSFKKLLGVMRNTRFIVAQC